MFPWKGAPFPPRAAPPAVPLLLVALLLLTAAPRCCLPVQLGLLNVADYNFVQRALEALHAALQAGLLRNDPLTIRLGLRILATLVSPDNCPCALHMPCCTASRKGAIAARCCA